MAAIVLNNIWERLVSRKRIPNSGEGDVYRTPWSALGRSAGGVGRSVRSRLLPVWPQRDGALPVAVTPQLARPLVLVPVGGGKTGPERMVVEGGLLLG